MKKHQEIHPEVFLAKEVWRTIQWMDAHPEATVFEAVEECVEDQRWSFVTMVLVMERRQTRTWAMATSRKEE